MRKYCSLSFAKWSGLYSLFQLFRKEILSHVEGKASMFSINVVWRSNGLQSTVDMSVFLKLI